MSAAVVCRKRSFFDDLPPSPTSASPPLSKKLRCSPESFAVSPPSPSSISSLLDHLASSFPDMSMQIIDKALQDCGYDLDTTIRKLDELRLSYANLNCNPVVEDNACTRNGIAAATDEPESAPSVDDSPQGNIPLDGAGWVELLVREMMSATSVDDARSRAGRVLEVLEKSINGHAVAEAAQVFRQSIKLKEKNDLLLQENACLKKAVVMLVERQKDYDNKKQEVEQLKQSVDQYKGQLSALELKNYALTMYLQQNQQGSFLQGHFPPDTF